MLELLDSPTPLPIPLIDPPPPEHPAATDDLNYWTPSVWNHVLFGWGCVRFDEKDADGYVVPRLHMNKAHNTSAMVSVSASRDVPAAERDLLFQTEGGGDIGTMMVQPDETLTAKKVTCGPSGGQPTTKVPMFVNGTRVPANSSQLYSPWANLWCFWLWAKDGPSPIVQAFEQVANYLANMLMELNRLSLENTRLSGEVERLDSENTGLRSKLCGVVDRLEVVEGLVLPPAQQ